MFTLDQIGEAHSKVKNGADFPHYIQNLIKLGVIHYSTFVSDGHTIFFGEKNVRLESPPKYDNHKIAAKGNAGDLAHHLKIHQAGETDYPTFCSQAADAGVEKWTVDTNKMTCTYYDKSGNALITEEIPGR